MCSGTRFNRDFAACKIGDWAISIIWNYWKNNASKIYDFVLFYADFTINLQLKSSLTRID